jgi:hypothetical protein
VSSFAVRVTDRAPPPTLRKTCTPANGIAILVGVRIVLSGALLGGSHAPVGGPARWDRAHRLSSSKRQRLRQARAAHGLSASCQRDSSKRVARRLTRKAVDVLKSRVFLDPSSLDQLAGSTSWGSLVRAQYRPFVAAPRCGIRMVPWVRRDVRAGYARCVRTPVRTSDLGRLRDTREVVRGSEQSASGRRIEIRPAQERRAAERDSKAPTQSEQCPRSEAEQRPQRRLVSQSA